MIFINPCIIAKSNHVVRLGEACISVPKVEGKVERNYSIHVNSIVIPITAIEKQNQLQLPNLDLKYKEIMLTEYSAQIFQHEMDHLNGILFIDKLHYISDKIKAKLKLRSLSIKAASS